MDTRDFSDRVAAELPAVNLTELYARLDEELRPFEMRVSKARISKV